MTPYQQAAYLREKNETANTVTFQSETEFQQWRRNKEIFDLDK